MTCQSAQIKVTTSWTLPYPPNVLRQKQLEDPDIAPIIKWKEKEERPFGMEVSASSPATQHYWLYWKIIFQEDGVLYQKFEGRDGSGSHIQLITPESLHKEVLQLSHGN